MRPTDPHGRPDDKRLTRLAGRQHGVVALVQLMVLGYSERRIRSLVARGWLHRKHRGVYAVGHPKLTTKGRWLAAVMGCRTGAALSHRAAAALHDLWAPPSGLIDVTAPGRHTLAGVRCHISRRYETARVDAIPVTTIEQTALDLAEVLAPQRLRSLLEAIERRELLDMRRFAALIAARSGRRGVAPLRAALAELADEAPWSQSELETAFLEFVREHGLPEPRLNVFVAGELVDVHWPEHGVVVELDSWEFHKGHSPFEKDRRRDTILQIAGQRPIRLTQHRLTVGRAQLLADLRQLLSRAA